MTSQNSSNKFGHTSNDVGFFKEFFNNLKNITTENQLKDFELLKTDEERVRFVHKLFPENVKFPIELSESKNFQAAKDFKLKGNKEFGKNDNKAALDFYNKAILATPYTEENRSDLAIILANRSAALYHLEKYESALSDINWVLDLPYPKELRYKVLERKARCLLGLNKHSESLLEFRNTLQALDDSKLPTEKKLKMQTDIQIMLGIMTKPKTKSGHINAFLESSKTKNIRNTEEPKHKLCSPRNKIYESACDKFEISENNELGRYAAAISDIQAGDTILIEKPYCTAILEGYSLTHCTHCFKRTRVPYPCKTCSIMIFCSAECRTKAENYHRYECKILPSIYKAGASVMVLMAFRIITQNSLDFFLEIKNELQEKSRFKKYKSSDYLVIYNLVRHVEERQRNDFFERTVMSLFLLQCLKKANYFQNSAEDTKISDDEYFIASLILRHLQLLQFNAHEIFELEVASNRSINDSKTIFIGGGLFPTLALFNHSCDPDTTRYFDGTTVILRTTKPVRPGEMISENYGPIFTSTNKNERQATLKSQFWFDCNCTACVENWPMFHEMNRKILRFRCDARRENGGKFTICGNAVAVPVDTEEFMVPCHLCGQCTNILKGLKALQDTDAMFKQASKDMEKGNHQAALAIHIEIITILDNVMKPPFQDFTLCQQAIRKCMLTYGNKFLK